MSPEILSFATDDRMPERSVSPTREEVIERVDDWLARLKTLFDRIEEWAKGREFDIGRGETVQMHEELMRIRGLESAFMPVLRVDGRGGYALFKPKGLWVIGANGRIDVYTSKGVYALLDQASKLDTPHWTIHRNGDPLDGSDFEPGIIEQIV